MRILKEMKVRISGGKPNKSGGCFHTSRGKTKRVSRKVQSSPQITVSFGEIPAFTGVLSSGGRQNKVTSKFKYEQYKSRDLNRISRIRNHLFLDGGFYLRGDLR